MYMDVVYNFWCAARKLYTTLRSRRPWGTITAIVAHGLFASLARAIERRHHRHHVQYLVALHDVRLSVHRVVAQREDVRHADTERFNSISGGGRRIRLS